MGAGMGGGGGQVPPGVQLQQQLMHLAQAQQQLQAAIQGRMQGQMGQAALGGQRPQQPNWMVCPHCHTPYRIDFPPLSISAFFLYLLSIYKPSSLR